VSPPHEPVSLVGVYRARNARFARALSAPALERGWQVAWWALDEPAEDLIELTVGTGPGEKLPLVNEILRRVESTHGWLVVSDDDFTFDRGDVVRLVGMCRRLGLDLAQPARSDRGGGHEITFARRLSRARITNFVEVGPIFVVGPRFRSRIAPFPETMGMGWGVELDWADLVREGCVLGILDEVRITHEGQLAGDYDGELELEHLRQRLAARGIEHWPDVQETLDIWRPWQRRPRWTTVSRRSA
jgi:hypothetical protein